MIRIDPTVVHAVWAGRFQPFHLGHVSFLDRICLTFDGPIVVAVIASSTSEPSDAYSAEANLQHRVAKNPLTTWERLMMIRIYLEEKGLTNRIIPIGIPRPDTYWSMVRGFYPPKRVLCFSDRNTFETQKVEHWRSMGEAVRVFPSEVGTSGTEFKEIVRSRGDWRALLPSETVEYFLSIDGPARFAESE